MNVATQDTYMTADGRMIGPTVLEVRDITLKFGGVTAIAVSYTHLTLPTKRIV